jgi:hypothetical protein
MADQGDTLCSPYLRRRRRSLAQACWQIAEAHGLRQPPCGDCELADLCPYKLAHLKARPSQMASFARRMLKRS